MLVWVLLLSSAVDVSGTTSCPTGDQVAAQLSTILPAADTGAPRDRVHFQEIGDRVYVRLEDSEGATLAERTFERSDDCAALALAIAVVVAAWESDLHPELSPKESPPDEGGPGGSNAEVSPPSATAAPSTLPATTGDEERRARHAFGSEVLWGLGGSLAARYPGGAVVFGAGFRAPTRRAPRWGARAFGVLPLFLRDEVGTVNVSFWRPMALAKLWLSVAELGAARIEVEPAVGGSLLRLSNGRASYQVEPIVGLGSRFNLRPDRRVSPWVGLDGVFWPTPQVFRDRGSDARVRLPDWQLILSVGLAVSGGLHHEAPR